MVLFDRLRRGLYESSGKPGHSQREQGSTSVTGSKHTTESARKKGTVKQIMQPIEYTTVCKKYTTPSQALLPTLYCSMIALFFCVQSVLIRLDAWLDRRACTRARGR